MRLFPWSLHLDWKYPCDLVLYPFAAQAQCLLPIGILLHGIQICWLMQSGTLHSLLRERAEVQTCLSRHSYVQNRDQSRHSLHEWCFSHSKCDHVSGSQDAETLDVVNVKGLSPFIPI